jgi:hypothetical protein
MYYVKHGIFNYEVKINEFKCVCSKSLCDHLIFILINEFNFDYNMILFIHKLKKSLIKYLNIKTNKLSNNEIHSLLLIELNNILNDDCVICLNKLTYNNLNLFECLHCMKYCHKTCIDTWIKKCKINNVDVNCIFCKNIIINN